MNVEIVRFKVLHGKNDKVDEWMDFLNTNMKDVLLTLENEKMFVETIFRETVADSEYLYWYSIQGTGGQNVEDSTHWIDQKHLEYWDECIDKSFTPVKLSTEVVMIPEQISELMDN